MSQYSLYIPSTGIAWNGRSDIEDAFDQPDYNGMLTYG